MGANPHLFPVEASILSGDAIGRILTRDYALSSHIEDTPTTRCRLYYRSIHDTYVVMSATDTFYLKVYRYALRTKEEIQAEVDLVSHLGKMGIAATQPVPKSDGGHIVEFETVQGTRYGVLYTSVGVRQYTEDDETDAFNELLGEYMASVHRAWDDFSVSGQPARRWNLDEMSLIDTPMRHIRQFAAIYPMDLQFLEKVAEHARSSVARLSKSGPGWGICHGDFYSGNVRLNESGNPVLIDFDFCGYGWRAYDLALYINSFSWGADPAKAARMWARKEAFLRGYSGMEPKAASSVGPVNDHAQARDLEWMLSSEGIWAINLFTVMRRLFNMGIIYISMANTWGDHWATRNVQSDIETLKRWVEVNEF